MTGRIGGSKRKPGGAVKRHPISMCDKLLRRDPSYNANRCQPERWTCECGRRWVHVCDEAEGCSYVEARP